MRAGGGGCGQRITPGLAASLPLPMFVFGGWRKGQREQESWGKGEQAQEPFPWKKKAQEPDRPQG